MKLDHMDKDTPEQRKRRIKEVKAQLESFKENPRLKTTDKETYKIVRLEAKLLGVVL